MARTRDPEILERLMEAGVRVFGSVGLSEARISDVAREMGVSHGTIYNYVESKDALFYLLVDWWLREGPPALDEADLPLSAPPEERLLERLAQRVQELFALPALDAALEQVSVPPADPGEELRGIVGELYDRTARTRRAADMIERSARDVPALAAFFDAEVRGPLFRRVERYLRLRTRMGVVSCPDPEAGARLLVETVTYAARHRHRDPRPPDAPDASFRATTLDVLCGGLLAPPARRGASGETVDASRSSRENLKRGEDER